MLQQLTVASSTKLQCKYFNAGTCRSCSLLGTPNFTQLAEKTHRCKETVHAAPDTAWLEPFTAGDRGFRNRVKLVIGGVAGDVTLGILGPDGQGVDLRDCAIQSPGIAEVIPALATFLNSTALAPYDVPHRRGELKMVHVTQAPAHGAIGGESAAGALMIRFVVRSELAAQKLRKLQREMRLALPRASVLSINLLPEHKAALEGEHEELLLGESLPMPLGPVTLHLRPQSFFQTNTQVAIGLYQQVAEWINEVQPAKLWDLYCGVGGFALHCSSAARQVLGVEIAEAAVQSARRSANEANIPATFLAADATEFALGSASADLPDALIVNPPRRGLGQVLSEWIERSGIAHVVYSSCNPESLARDLAEMPSYEVKTARLFDMFPHTNHLEVAVRLQRKQIS